MAQEDYYKTLHIPKEADAKQIKEAFRKLAFKYHPDRNEGNPKAADEMKRINEAYAVLSNSEKRREYDSIRQQFGDSAHNRFRTNYSDQDIFRGSDINHIFEEMAKAFGVRGGDEIFKEFYGPEYQKFEFKRPGLFMKGFIFTGVWGKGKKQPDLFTAFRNINRFANLLADKIGGNSKPINGSDMDDTIHLSPEEAKSGGPFPYLFKKKKKKLVVKIPAGISEGQRIRLTGMGEEGKGGGRSGDLYLKVKIGRSLVQKTFRLVGQLFQ